MTFEDAFRKWLTPDEFDRAMANTELERLSDECTHGRGCIMNAFGWPGTPEGADYWVDIHRRIRNAPEKPFWNTLTQEIGDE